MRHRFSLLFVAALLVSTVGWLSPAAALVIRGDYLWVQDPTCTAGWSAAAVDDSQWKEAVYPNVLMWQRYWELDAEARPLWGDAHTSCVRRHFQLDAVPKEATVKVWADDDYDLYINGSLVGKSNDGWAQMPGEIYDVAGVLKAGDNVIAMQLMDRVGEHYGALFVLDIPGASDEPSSWASVIGPLRQAGVFAGVLLAATLIVIAVRLSSKWLAPHVGRWSAALLGTLTVALALIAQWFFQTQPLYQYIMGQPLTEWSWPTLGLALAILATLAVLLAGQPVSERVAEPPRGEKWILLAILGLAAYFRIVDVDTVPPGFFQDEAINGLDSIKIWQAPTFELWSDSIGGRPTIFLYALGAALRVFGISYAALKIVPVVVGMASVAALYALGRIAIGPRAALWAAFFFAVSRWHVHFTRMAWEVNCVPLFAVLGFALLLRGFERERRAVVTITAAALVLAAGLYTYAAYRAIGGVVIVFLLVTALSSDRRVLLSKLWALLVGGIAGAALVAPLLKFAIDNPVLYWGRYADVSLTTYMSYHSTPVPWLHQIGKALLSLNHRSDLDVFPYLDPVTGMLLLVGVASAAPAAYRRGFRLAWCWFLVFVALSSLTKDSPHATRMLGMLPAVLLLAGYGAFRFFDVLGRVSVRPVVRTATAAAAVSVATAVNAYWYFAEYQQIPEIDLVMNVGARTLCSELAEVREGSSFWTDDVAYNCKPQCAFLLAGTGAKMPMGMDVEDVINTDRLKAAEPPVTVIINNTTLERAGERIKRDENGDPLIDLPARPTIMLSREGKAMYFIYRY